MADIVFAQDNGKPGLFSTSITMIYLFIYSRLEFFQTMTAVTSFPFESRQMKTFYSMSSGVISYYLGGENSYQLADRIGSGGKSYHLVGYFTINTEIQN